MKVKIICLITGLCFAVGIILLVLQNTSSNGKIGWIRDLNYEKDQVYGISIGLISHEPSIPVKVNGKEIRVMFDTGNSRGLALSTAVNGKIDYEVTGKYDEVNPNGTYRGTGSNILLKNISIFGEEYRNVKSTVSDWRIFGDIKFNGLLGLGYFHNKVVTIDYKNKKIAISDKPINYGRLQNDKYTIVPLITSNIDNQKDLIYFEAEVNGKKSIVYLDTGYTRSFVDPGEKSNINKNNKVEVKIGNKTYEFRKIRAQGIDRGGSFTYPVELEICSDILKSENFVITIDKIDNKLIFHKA